jgi:hypothetical protein
MLDFAPDSLALQSLIRHENHVSAEMQELTGEDEELTVEEQVRKARDADMKERIKGLAQTRGTSFSRAAAKKTVADFQSDSEESEEDPDDEPPQKTSMRGSSGDGDQDSGFNSETDDDEATPTKRSNPDEHGEQGNGSKGRQPKMTSSVRNLIENPNESDSQLVMLYSVEQELTFNGEGGMVRILGQFLSRKEANDFATAKVQELRTRKTKSVSECTDDDDLYYATVVYGGDKKNQTRISVSATPIASSALENFDPCKVDYRLDEKTYLVIQYISQRRADEETGEIHIHHNEPEILSHFSQLEMANHEACTRLINLLKPPTSRMDDHQQHSELSQQLREGREAADNEKATFEAEIENHENKLHWASFHNVKMEVRLFPMKGPRN